jgi:hypothetical protein
MFTRKRNFQWNDEVRFVLDQHAKLDFLIHIILIPSQPEATSGNKDESKIPGNCSGHH